MEAASTLELLPLAQTKTKITTTKNVGGILVVMTQHCGQGLHTITVAKNMDQGKEIADNMFTQETVWEL